MNKNQENYKKALDQIKPSEELKESTFKKTMPKEKSSRPLFMRYIAACAVVAICFSVGAVYLKGRNPVKNEVIKPQTIAQNSELQRFEDMDQLKKALVLNDNYKYYFSDDTINTAAAQMDSDESSESAIEGGAGAESSSEKHSETNNQVDGVDEADIVKTNGNYIFYSTYENVYIINSKTLKTESVIKRENDRFTPTELFINDDKLVILGTGYEETNEHKDRTEEDLYYDYDYYYPYRYGKEEATVVVYDISNINKPKKDRELKVDGRYITSRMIGDNIYFIASKELYVYTIDDLKEYSDDDILPSIKDSKNEDRRIECTEIAYFPDTDDNTFMTVVGFNLNENRAASTETFYGASDTVYASKENLYVTQTQYDYTYLGYGKAKSMIYKFKLEDSHISLTAKTEVNGYFHDQFSLDEYNGNLRVATTNSTRGKTSNRLYVLDENLNEIGRTDKLAKGESIYSVRFIGKMGYIVTYKQIDPLFVIDLSDPTNPEVKGELKIPGYSAYLHPYDENHIIGIGYNTETNEYGGTVRTSLKMSMFDVSDMSNPKEMFSKEIGNKNSYSEITSNHKALFYDKERNLIGFPVVSYSYDYSNDDKNQFMLFEIDLEKGFKDYGALSNGKTTYSYYGEIRRAIYVGDTIYVLSNDKITSFNIKTLKQEKELELDE